MMRLVEALKSFHADGCYRFARFERTVIFKKKVVACFSEQADLVVSSSNLASELTAANVNLEKLQEACDKAVTAAKARFSA